LKYVSLLLHWYQPPTQDISLVAEIDGQCYGPVSRLLESSSARVAVNINWSLTEQLLRIGSGTPGHLSGASGVEFTDSGAYHPIFPLIDPADVARQIGLNRSGNAAVFGESYSPSGVFPPEMAWDPALAPLLAGLGYRWTVTDDIPWVWAGNRVPFDRIPTMSGLSVLLRSNFWSNRISFHGEEGRATSRELAGGLRDWTGESDSYVLIAMDVETFGHHRPGTVERFLAPFLGELSAMRDVTLVTPRELLDIFPGEESLVPAGSWSTGRLELDAGKPWPLWDDPDNPVHSAMWRLLEMVVDIARGFGWDRVAPSGDKMLYSCPFWWASTGRFSAVQVRRGLLAILETARVVFAETGDRAMLDNVMTAVCGIPVVTGEEKHDA
jgi:hypothetical protein